MNDDHSEPRPGAGRDDFLADDTISFGGSASSPAPQPASQPESRSAGGRAGEPGPIAAHDAVGEEAARLAAERDAAIRAAFSDVYVVSAKAEDRRRRRGGGVRRTLTAVTVIALVGGIAFGGYRVADFLSGGGTQPEDVLPASTVAFARVDFDPSAGQKANAFRLLRKFPSLDGGGDDLMAALLEDEFNQNPYGLKYQRDVAPWIGDRVAVAVLPAPQIEDGAAPVIVVEFTDEEKMTAALERIRREVESGWDEDHDGYGGSTGSGSSSSAPAEVYPSYSPPPGTSTESGSTTSENPGLESPEVGGPEVGGPATSSLGDEPTAPDPESTEVPSDGTTSEGAASDPAKPEGDSPYAEGHEEDPDADGAVPGGTDSLVPSGGETAEPGTNPQLQPGQVEPYPGQVLPGQFQTLQPGQLETLQPGQLELRTGAPGELQPGLEVRPAEPGTDPGVVTSDPEYLSEEPYEADQGDDDDTGEEFAYAVRGSYVFLGEYQEVLDRAVRSETVLADDPAFASDVDAIGVDDQVAVAWADLGRAYDLMSEADRDDLRSFLGVSDPSGRVVVGTHLEPDYVEVVARSRDVRTSGLTADLAAQPGSELVRGLPSDVDFAFSATGLGDALARMYDRGEGLPLLGMVEDRSEAPVTDPSEALRALFGTEFAAGITIADEDWDLVLRGDTDDPAQAAEVLRPLLDLTGEPDLVVEQLDGGYVASTDQGFAQAAGASSGGLGDDPRFTRAVADPEGAHAVLFLDLARTFAVWDPEDEELAPLSALGISLTGTPEDGVFTLRLTTK